MTRFRFVSDHADLYGVKRLCRTLKVSRSGYYDWRLRPESGHAQRDAEFTELIEQIYARSRTTYGVPRVHAELRRLDQRCSRKRVARLMANKGLVGAHARRKWRRGRPDVAPAPDLVNRDFSATRPDEVWAADVTQFWTSEGWLYFAGVIDLYLRLYEFRCKPQDCAIGPVTARWTVLELMPDNRSLRGRTVKDAPPESRRSNLAGSRGSWRQEAFGPVAALGK